MLSTLNRIPSNRPNQHVRRNLKFEQLHDVLNCKKVVLEMKENIEKTPRPLAYEMNYVVNKCNECLVMLDKIYQMGRRFPHPEYSLVKMTYKEMVNRYGQDVGHAYEGYVYLLRHGLLDRKCQLTFKCLCRHCKDF